MNTGAVLSEYFYNHRGISIQIRSFGLNLGDLHRSVEEAVTSSDLDPRDGTDCQSFMTHQNKNTSGAPRVGCNAVMK